jgi:hypothetical protein
MPGHAAQRHRQRHDAGHRGPGPRWDIGKLHMHSPASSSGFFERLGYVNAGKDKACFGLECDFLWKQLDAAEPPAASASAPAVKS